MDHIAVLKALVALGMKQDEIARELGTSQPQVARWLKGQEPKAGNVSAIRRLGRKRGVVAADFSDDDFEKTTKKSGDIPNFNIFSGAGNGGLIDVEYGDHGYIVDPNVADGYWSFPDSVKAGWRGMGRTYAFPVIGDSMEPTIANGSYVFVDTGHTVPSPPDIYAIDYGDGLMIKRVEPIPGGESVRVISDNDHYSDYELSREEVRVYGRVVAWFQWRG